MGSTAATLWTQASENRQTIAVITLVALAIQLGLKLPLPFPALAAADPQAARALSIFAFSASAWLTAVVAIELFALLFVMIRNSELCAGQHANPFARGTLVLTLVVAGSTTLVTTANVFNAVAGDRASLSAADLAIPCISSTAATAILVGLGKILNRALAGYGFWAFLLLLNSSGLPQEELWFLDAYLKLAISGKSLLIVAATTLLIVLISVWQFGLVGYRSTREANANLYPWLAAGILPSYLLSLLPTSFIQSSFMQDNVELIFAVVSFVLIAGLAAVYFQRAKMAHRLLPSICAWFVLLAVPVIARRYNAAPLFDAVLALLLALFALRLCSLLQAGKHSGRTSISGR